MSDNHQPTSLHRRHHHPRFDSYSPQFNPSFHPPPSSPLPHPSNTYPNFYPNLPLPPPLPDFHIPPPPPPTQQPDFHIPPPTPLSDYHRPYSPFPFSSPNCNPPIEHTVEFRVSRPHPDHRFTARGRDDWEPSPSFNRGGGGGGGYAFHSSVSPRHEVGDFRHPFAGVDFNRPSRYDSACSSRSNLCSSGYGGFVQNSASSSVGFHGDEVHRGWGFKRKQREDAPRTSSSMKVDDYGLYDDGGYGDSSRRGSTGYANQVNTRAPNRNVQKKNVFSRLMTSNPAHKNYHDKSVQSSRHCNSSKISPFKVKYSSPAKHRSTKERESATREENHVHMSFKSNSLVTKQIATPSGTADGTDENCTPRNRKFRKLAGSNTDELNLPLEEVNKSPMKLRVFGRSPENLSRPDKSNKLNEGSDCGLLGRNVLDIYTSPVRPVDGIVNVSSAGGSDPRSSKYISKRDKRKSLSECEVPSNMQPIDEQFKGVSSLHTSKNTKIINHEVVKRAKMKKFSEYEVPLSMQPIVDKQCGGVSSSPPTTIKSDKDTKESSQMLPNSLNETACLLFSVDDRSNHNLPQETGAATREYPVKECCNKRSDNHESKLISDCFSKEVSTDVLAAEVNEVDCSEYSQDKCILLPHLEAHLPCSTIVDQSSSEGAIDKGIIGEHTVTVSVDDNNNADHEIGYSMKNIINIKETSRKYDSSDSIPAGTAQENDVCNKVTVDFDKSSFTSPDRAEIEKKVTSVLDKGLASVDVSYRDFEVAARESEEAAPYSECVVGSGLLSGSCSSRSVALCKDECSEGIFNLAHGSSESAGGIDVAITNKEADSDPDVRSSVCLLDSTPNVYTDNKSKDLSMTLEISKDGVDGSIAVTELGRTKPVDGLPSTNVVMPAHKSKDVSMTLENNKDGVEGNIAVTELGRTEPVDGLPSTNVVTPAHISSVRNLHSLNSSSATLERMKYQKSTILPAPVRTSSSLCVASTKINASKLNTINSRTWRRSDNDSSAPLSGKKPGSNFVPPHSRILKGGKPQTQSTSYIRKGNSLVRNPSLVITVSRSPQDSIYAAPQQSFPGFGDEKKALDENKDDLTLEHMEPRNTDNLLNIQKYEVCQLLEKTSSSSSDTIPVKSSDNCPKKAITNHCPESNSASMIFPDDSGPVQLHDELKSKGTAENQTELILVAQTALDKGSISSKSDNKLCVKHSSYQPISDSGPSHLPVEKAQNNQIMSSDGYYKTRKNQIIRTPLDGAQPLTFSTKNLDAVGQHAKNMVNRVGTLKSYKVWTLEGAQSNGKLTPGQFQYKRATSWRDMRNSGASSNNRSSLMLRKLTLYRNQNALYKRSTHGLSLRKFKVLALGGCSLKWSKSIERRSKKASEDATRAVVAAESLKKEQSRLQHAISKEKIKHHSSRGRLFRIGSVRYRMDPSRKSLRRVVDDGSPLGALEGKESKRVYVPRRLVIGKNEYIRIGNGNQLVRDPKKHIRMLANEKIRWSLHNVRLRAVKKRRFCQFYTRFGKCNKDDGKCPFIHDSSKIAVCTKFLNGICSDPNCKLTHKVIPERMEDCSYFLQGMCSNEKCPYRHVNVNPNAQTCEGFLKGYCADGDECKKKHSYVCHVFEETGSCPQGSKCRFHHPKKRKGKNSNSKMQNFSKGRYFGYPALEASDYQTVVLMKQLNASIFQDGEIPDFISLNTSDDDTDDVNMTEEFSYTSKHSDNAMDIEVCDLDTLIKPIRIMNKDNTKLHTQA